MASQMSKKDMMRELDEKAKKYVEKSGTCAQSSFLALRDQFKLDDGAILKALTPFPGLAYRGGVCGTVVGCIMALGLAFGRESMDDWDGNIQAIPSVRAFYRRFKRAIGSIICLDVVESEFGKRFEAVEPAETKRWLKANAIEKCSATIGTGVRIAAEILLERTKKV